MKVKLDFHPASEPQDVTLTLSGKATIGELLTMLETVTADERFRPGMSILVDDTAVDVLEISAEDVRVFADALVRNPKIGRGTAAIVAPETVAYGFARMLESQAAQLRLRVFVSRNDAVDWLTSWRR